MSGMKRYDQCDGTCTVDCGHCKGMGMPVDQVGHAREWYVCPLRGCGHGSVYHDGDGHDEKWVCCVAGCPCSGYSPDGRSTGPSSVRAEKEQPE